MFINDSQRIDKVNNKTIILIKVAVEIHSYKTIIDRWHKCYTPLSLIIHPHWHYYRNVVEIKLSEDSNDWDGIVEEHMKTRSELLNPFKFFGNPLMIIPRMINVYTDTKSFLHYGTIEPYLVKEYWVNS